MFGLGLPEMGIIAIVALLIFGPKRIPEMGKALGKTMRGFKDEMSTPQTEQTDPETSETPEKLEISETDTAENKTA